MSERSVAYVIHERDGSRIAELTASDVALSSSQDILDIIGDLWGYEADALILHESSVAPAFFDLSTGLAGEILQKCTNYGLRFALVGDFGQYASESLQAFIRESNRGGRIRFVSTIDEALEALAVE